MDNNALPSGTLLRHKSYRIDTIIGQGGFGITYLAHDLNLDRKVAIKEFFPKTLCKRDETTSNIGTKMDEALVTQLKAKFLKEARNIARFDSPGIIKIHAAFEENDTAYYVMDYIDGMSLSDMIKSEGPLDEPRAIHYIENVGRALEYIHERNINHLDVKPANMMIRKADDQAILIDFGLSKRYDKDNRQTSFTPTGVSKGFAPMEQYRTDGVNEFSPQTDIYSLAASLYYILTGVVPPEAQDLIDQELMFPDGIPAHLMAPIAKAMSPSRKNRHESVRDFLEDIGITDTVATAPIQPSTTDNQDSYEAILNDIYGEKKSKKWLWASLITVVILIIAGTALFFNEKTPKVGKPIPVLVVEDQDWESPLGPVKYTGRIDENEAENGIIIPNGRGKAVIQSGEYKDCIYEGEFVNGQMNGKATYTLPSGDRFVGTFKDNHYERGRYIIHKTGEYFEGSFDQSGNPSKGRWYNKNGDPIK
ncbi:MAG: protein kinase [Bacteroides sp.]|nr:protein kinase [Bacteroides sp.]